jgi:hypothetical protein
VDRKKGHQKTLRQKQIKRIALTDTGLGGEKGKHLCCDVVTKDTELGDGVKDHLCCATASIPQSRGLKKIRDCGKSVGVYKQNRHDLGAKSFQLKPQSKKISQTNYCHCPKPTQGDIDNGLLWITG